MRRMGEKKFWKVLESINVCKDCHGYEGILNLLSIAYGAMEKESKYCADDYRQRADALYEYLEKSGYYKFRG